MESGHTEVRVIPGGQVGHWHLVECHHLAVGGGQFPVVGHLEDPAVPADVADIAHPGAEVGQIAGGDGQAGLLGQRGRAVGLFTGPGPRRALRLGAISPSPGAFRTRARRPTARPAGGGARGLGR